jgi:uroporphyrinogen decarboxylase
MNDRQRFIATMHYQPRDRCPLYDFNFWDETVPEWKNQGLPEKYSNASVREYFGLDSSLGGGEPDDWLTGVRPTLFPTFDSKVLEDFGDEYTELQNDGVIVKKQRSSVSIPMHVGHTLVDRQSWREHYLPRLDPTNPGRIPADWDRRVAVWCDPNRSHPVFPYVGSYFGRIRDWMGLENVAMVIYDDPAWFEEMVTTLADLSIAMAEKMLATGAKFEAFQMWEDMCYNAGPLISPAHFKKYIVPHYKRLSDLARKHGVDVIWLDCDGRIDDLIPLWLDAGINCMFPVEIGTWGADPLKLRQKLGRDLLMMGGFDKHILQKSKRDIEREVCRLAPLVEEGGFIPFADHRVPPDVPLENYVHYAKVVRQVWGKDVNLKPMVATAQASS